MRPLTGDRNSETDSKDAGNTTGSPLKAFQLRLNVKKTGIGNLGAFQARFKGN